MCGCGTTAPDNRIKPDAGSGASGVFGNTLCLNADASAKDTYARIESLFGKGAIEAPSDNAYSPTRPHVFELDGAAGPYFVIQAIEPTDINLDGTTLAQGSDRHNLVKWRTGADHMRPKWGIYRKHHAMLNQHREDSMYFTGFGLTGGMSPTTNCH